jgi:hypothetical protein
MNSRFQDVIRFVLLAISGAAPGARLLMNPVSKVEQWHI